MIRRLALSALVVLSLGAESAQAAVEDAVVNDVRFPFEGLFGAFDQAQLQRGLQVYTEVCSACHGLKFVPLRTLGDAAGPGLPEDQVRAYAATMDIDDPETGETRSRVPTDPFPGSGLANAPDLSVMAKARAGFHGPYGLGINQFLRGTGGPEYIHALLTGYTGEEKEEAGVVLYENTAFPSRYLQMMAPLSDGQVEFADGSPNTVDAMSMDVSAFLMWTAEPHMMARKQTGFIGFSFLAILAVLLYLTNKRIWAPIKMRERNTPAE